MITEDELRALAPEEWQEVWGLVLAEHDRRLLLESAPVDAARLADAYLTARDGEQPPAGTSTAQPDAWPAWVQPQGAHDAYPAGYIVQHEGRLWRSAHPANSWAPGTGDLWVEVTPDQAPAPEPAPSAPEWTPGTKYNPGDLVAYDGQVYRVVQEHTSQADWRPDGVPALYTPAH